MTGVRIINPIEKTLEYPYLKWHGTGETRFLGTLPT